MFAEKLLRKPEVVLMRKPGKCEGKKQRYHGGLRREGGEREKRL